MIVLYGTNTRLLDALERALRTGFAVTRAATWRDVERATGVVACIVIVIEHLTESLEFQQLVRLTARLPEQPVVLVTARDVENARQLRRLIVEEVFWTCEPVQEVRAAAERLGERRTGRMLARELEGAEHLPPQLRSALVHACASPAPVQSVAALAARLGCDRCTLSRQWRTAVGPRADARLQDFLDWQLLLRAVALRAAGRKWAAVAAALGVHPHTLSRAAARLCGDSPSVLAKAGPAALRQRFRQTVLRQVLRLSEAVTICATAAQSAATGERLAAS